MIVFFFFFFFSSRRRHTRCSRDWSSDVCSSDLTGAAFQALERIGIRAAVGKCLMDAHPEGAPLELAESTDNALAEAESRSEERRVGKECRSRSARGD